MNKPLLELPKAFEERALFGVTKKFEGKRKKGKRENKGKGHFLGGSKTVGALFEGKRKKGKRENKGNGHFIFPLRETGK